MYQESIIQDGTLTIEPLGEITEESFTTIAQAFNDVSEKLQISEEKLQRLETAVKIAHDRGIETKKIKNGKTSNDDKFTKIMLESSRELVKTLTLPEKGLLHDLLCYLGYDNYITNGIEGHWVNVKQIAKMINGCKERQVMNILSSLEQKGVLSRKKNGNQTYIIINDKYYRRKK